MSNQNNWNDAIQIHNPKTLGTDCLPAQRVPLGAPGDYKPCIARLPDGELITVAFRQHPLDRTRRIGDREIPLIREDILLFRSQDDGVTWSEPETLDLPGREPYLTILSDGTILITVHHLVQDVRNEAGYVQTYVHRSTDRGGTWQITHFPGEDLPGWQPGWSICSSRNALELRDGGLILGVGTKAGYDYLFRSPDKGATWQRAEACTFELFEREEDRKKRSFPLWGEAIFYEAANGDLLALNRVGAGDFPPLPGVGDVPDGHWDHHDRLVLYRSRDGGTYWSFAELGSTYGEMYPAILKLQDSRLLLTFTIRDLRPPLGVRAVLGQEIPDGFDFDFEHDRLMLDTGTPLDRESGGGFGRTIQLDDGTLLTSYSYMGADDRTHCEVVRWKLPDRSHVQRNHKKSDVVSGWTKLNDDFTTEPQRTQRKTKLKAES